MSAFAAPEGAFPWGDPRFGRPRVTILSRFPEALSGQRLHRILAEVEIGVDRRVSVRLEVRMPAGADLEACRIEAYRAAVETLDQARDHLAALDEALAITGPGDAFRADLMATPVIGGR
jgi:hypothetical protein